MTGKVARSSLVGVVLAITVVAGVPGVAFERGAARTSSLQRDVQVLSPRTLREPSAAAYDLKRLQRRLHEQRIEAPRDPRVPALELETRRLRWQADRAARRSRAAVRICRGPRRLSPERRSRSRAISGGLHTPPGMPAARPRRRPTRGRPSTQRCRDRAAARARRGHDAQQSCSRRPRRILLRCAAPSATPSPTIRTFLCSKLSSRPCGSGCSSSSGAATPGRTPAAPSCGAGGRRRRRRRRRARWRGTCRSGSA